MDEVSFARDAGDGIVIAVNGRPLPEVVGEVERPHAIAEGHPGLAGGYAPLRRSHLREEPSAHLLGSARSHLHSGPPDKTVLCACECGEAGCWPLLARVETDDATVAWTDFEQPHRRGRWDYEGFALRFDRRQYEQACAGLT